MKKTVSIALILILILCTSAGASGASSKAVDAADKLYGLGLFSGTGKDENGAPIYDLDRLMNRQEAMTMYINMLGKGPEAMAGSWTIPFKDVAAWATPFVGCAYEKGLTAGFSETQFGSKYPITATQYMTYLLLSLGYESGTDFLWNGAASLADKIGLSNGAYKDTDNLSRGDVVILSEAALRTKLKDGSQTLAQQLMAAGVFAKETWDEVYASGEVGSGPVEDAASGSWADHYDKAFYRKIASEYTSSYESEETALRISTPEQLAAFAAFTNARADNSFAGRFVVLEADISIGAYEWVPACAPEYTEDEEDRNLHFYSSGGFAGTFSGSGHVVSDLRIDQQQECIAGLFGAVQEGGTVADLTVSGFIRANWNIGGITAYNMGGTIRDCRTAVTIRTTGLCAGGIAGQCSGGTISGCTAEGSITGTKESGNLGGIAGWSGYSIIENCRNSGNLIGGYRIGGIAGRLSNEGKIHDCENGGGVTSLQYGSGSVAGVADGDNCEIVNSK